MPEGPLGFPRLTDIGPFVTEDIGWVLHPEVYSHIWNEVESSDAINFGPEPAVLIVHDNSSLDNELMHEQLFTRIPGEQYDEPYEWEQITSRFSTDGRRSTLEKSYSDQTLDLFPDEVKFQTQMYTAHGAMITFDFQQKYNEPVSGFMRLPATESMIEQVKRSMDGLPHMEYFEIQSRQESGEFATVKLQEAQSFYHPHFRSDGVKTREEMKRVFTVMVEVAEEYERRRSNNA